MVSFILGERRHYNVDLRLRDWAQKMIVMLNVATLMRETDEKWFSRGSPQVQSVQELMEL